MRGGGWRSGSVASSFPGDYDVVGGYNQDEINGFTDELLERMLDLAQLSPSHRVLDAMAGDGNLSARLVQYCQQRDRGLPEVVLLEISPVQTAFAQAELSGTAVQVLPCDAVTMTHL